MQEKAHYNESWVIYNRIGELRSSKGSSQKELAEELGLNRRTVGYIERQDHEPSPRLAWRTADYFGVEFEDMLYRAETSQRTEGSPPPAPPHSEESGHETMRRLGERPEARHILTALLDNGLLEVEELVRRTRLDAADLTGSWPFLES